ncbi:unnamed protein product [Urochloa decumbens]|uniref:Uncharacterized protein n=1 Tax=Urochloa decumbens TaxID=240449 RepID=A0ABC9GS69_9POAL
MRTSVVAFAALLLLLLLATRAHGIRLDRQLHEAINSKQMGDPKPGDGDASVADSVKEHCITPDGRCSGAKVEKSLADADKMAEAKQQQVSVSSTRNGGHYTTVDAEAAEAASSQGSSSRDASAAGSSRRVPRQRQQIYPDLMDIAGMDYSPASRKPPIHN